MIENWEALRVVVLYIVAYTKSLEHAGRERVSGRGSPYRIEKKKKGSWFELPKSDSGVRCW